MLKADNSTFILFLGGKKRNVAEHKVLCKSCHYEQDDPIINKIDPPFPTIPSVILCFKDFVSHEATYVFKKKADKLNVPFVIASGGLGSLVEQARLQHIDLSGVIMNKPKTSSIVASNNGNGNGNGNGIVATTSGMSWLTAPVRDKDSLPPHYDTEFRDRLHPSVEALKIDGQSAILVIKNKNGSHALHVKGRVLEEADRLATKYGCNGDAAPLDRFVTKNIAEKIVQDFNRIIGGRGISYDYHTIQKALNLYRKAETPERFKKDKKGRKMNKTQTQPAPKPIPVPQPQPQPQPQQPAPQSQPAPAPQSGGDNLPSATLMALTNNPSNAEKIIASVDSHIADIDEILKEIHGKIQRKRSISGNNAFEIFLTEMALHFRDEDETKKELVQLYKEYVKLHERYATLSSEHAVVSAQWIELTDQLKVKIIEVETLREEVKKWKALAAQS